MKMTQTWLAGLFAAQLALAGGLFVADLQRSAGSAPRPLLGFAMEDVERVLIEDGSSTATLQREDAGWQLPRLAGLPVNGQRLNSLLENLTTVETRHPVADSAAARQRFSLEEERYERRLRFYRGDTVLGEFFLGSSPGFRQTHGRRAGEDEVHVLALNAFDFPADDNDWLDKTLLRASAPSRIEGSDFALERDGETWRFDPAGEAVDEAQVSQVVSALENLRVQRVADAAPAGEPLLLRVSASGGEHEYRFAEDGEAGRYYVQRGDHEQWFTLNHSDYRRFADLSRASLTAAEPAPSAAEDADLSAAEEPAGAEQELTPASAAQKTEAPPADESANGGDPSSS